jgi:DNA repair exonuclease SbcCD ATPase subunit
MGMIDLLLIGGAIKAFIELSRYKQKSVSVLKQVYHYLKSDLAKFEKIKAEHEAISKSHKKLQSKIVSFATKSHKHRIEDYQGWDSQVCPNCHASLEMLTEICPQCHHNLGKIYTN